MVYVTQSKKKKHSYESLVVQHTTTVELYVFMVSKMLVIFCGQYADWSNLYVLLLESKKTINILRVRLIRTWNASRIIACGFYSIKCSIRKFLYLRWKNKSKFNPWHITPLQSV